MNPTLSASLFSVLGLAAPLLAQGGEVDLRLVAKKGASVWLVQEVKEEQNIDAGVQQMEMTNTIVHTLFVTVKDVDDKGIVTVETKIARIHGDASMGPMGDVEFDSLDADDEEPVEGDMLAAMTKARKAGAGKVFTAKVDQNGQVTELLADAKELIASTKSPAMGGNSIDESMLKKLVEGAFGVRPEKPMAAGGTWQHNRKEAGSRMPTENKIELTLSKVEADAFEVAAKGTVEKAGAIDGEKPADGEDGMAAAQRQMMKDMKVSNGKISGTQRISRQDGFVLDSTKTMTMDMEMSSPMGSANIEVKVTVSTKRTTEDAAKPKKAEPKPAEPAKDEKKVEPPKEEPKDQQR